MIPHSLVALPDLSLRALTASFRDGPMARGVQPSVVQSIVGASAVAVLEDLRALEQSGFDPAQVGTLLESLLAEREQHPRPESLIELVLSGPAVEAVPMQDTAAVMQTLVRGAEREILLVGYAVHDGRSIFRDLAERLDARSGIRATLCLNIPRGGDTSASPLIVHRFVGEFGRRHWPGKRLPSLYYLPASLELDPTKRASLHAKCVVVDRSQALVTSANFTEAAQERNVEIGLLVRHPPVATRIVDYFDGLISRRVLARCDLAVE